MSSVARMQAYIDFKGIKKSEFYKKTGLSNGYLDKVKDLGSEKIESIISIYVDLNLEWLITGNGPMIKENAPPARPDQDYNKLKDEIAILRKEIESLLKDKVDLLNRIVNLQDESHNKSHQHTNIRTKPGKLKSN